MMIETEVIKRLGALTNLTAQDIRSIVDEANDVMKDLTAEDFSCAIFGILRLQNICKFEIYTLEQHLVKEFAKNESLRVLFWDIDPEFVTDEGLSMLSIIGAGEYVMGSSIPKARLKFSKEVAEKFVSKLHPSQKELIEGIVNRFLHPELIKEKELERKLKI